MCLQLFFFSGVGAMKGWNLTYQKKRCKWIWFSLVIGAIYFFLLFIVFLFACAFVSHSFLFVCVCGGGKHWCLKSILLMVRMVNLFLLRPFNLNVYLILRGYVACNNNLNWLIGLFSKVLLLYLILVCHVVHCTRLFLV